MPLIKLNKLRQILSGFIILSHERDYRLCNTCDALLQCMFPEDGSEKEVFPWDKECQKYNPEHPVRKPARRVLFFKKNPKLELLEELLTDLGVNSVQQEKAIIWVMYKPDLVLIGDMLDKAKIPYVTSDTPQCESAFQDNKSNLVFLSQVSAGVGLTLTTATSMINYSYSLDLDHRLQSLERNYRIGQNRKTLVKDLVHPVSVEDGILAMLAKKQDVKDFMQSTNVCMKCPTTKRMECLERQVWPYAQDCIHYETRLAAEKKEAIKIV
jgi:SNF2 family DNA or RNA helicase